MLAEQADTQPYVIGLALHVVARHLGAALVRAQQGGQDADQGGLSRAVGAEHAVDTAARDPQVEPVQGGLVAYRFRMPSATITPVIGAPSRLSHIVKLDYMAEVTPWSAFVKLDQ